MGLGFTFTMRYQLLSLRFMPTCALSTGVSGGYVPPKKILFNWEKIKNLRGYEKIELFRDYARTVDTENAFKVYKIMKDNDLLVRLTYIDHHKMFHLLLRDKLKYKQDIIDVWNWLKSNEYYPSVGLYKDMFTCYKTWRDMHGAKELYKEMVSNNLQIVPEIHEIMLSFYANHKSRINHLEGIRLWNDIKDTKLNPKLVGIAMELFGKLKMTVAAHDLFEQMRHKFPKEGIHRLRLEALYLGALIHAEEYKSALAFYEKTFQNVSWIEGSKNPSQIYKTVYQIMMKLCYKTGNLELAEKLLEEMDSHGLFLNHAIKCRFLVICGVKRDVKEAEDLFNSQTVDLDSRKVLSTYRLALLEVYTTRLERAKAEKLAQLFTISPFDFLAKLFMEKMYRNLGDIAEAERMSLLIKDFKTRSPKLPLDSDNQKDSTIDYLE
jgi:pentatricopeptide repeat protein